MKENTVNSTEEVEVKESQESQYTAVKVETEEEVKKVEEATKTEVKEEKEQRTKESESEKAEVDVEALKNELAEANKRAQEVETLQTTIEAMKKDSESKDAVIKEYEELVGKMVETKMGQVPAEFKDLIPDNLDLKQKLSWLEKAETKGLFIKEEKTKPNVEIGKPMNIEAPAVDTTKLSASQLLKMAYNSVKK